MFIKKIKINVINFSLKILNLQNKTQTLRIFNSKK